MAPYTTTADANKLSITTDNFDGYILQPSDFEEYFEMLQDKEFILRYGQKVSRECADIFFTNGIKHWETHNYGPWIFRDKLTMEYVGCIVLRNFEGNVELAYGIKPIYWGNKVGTQLCKAVIKYAFEHLKIKSLTAYTSSENKPSIMFLESLGFHYEKDYEHEGQMCKYYRLENN